jgi:hypothetical protein
MASDLSIVYLHGIKSFCSVALQIHQECSSMAYDEHEFSVYNHRLNRTINWLFIRTECETAHSERAHSVEVQYVPLSAA